MNHRRSVWLCALGAFLAAAPARAGLVDKFLPEDSEIVVSVNVRQIAQSDLFQKNVEEQAREALKNSGELNDVLKDIGIDPFRDIDRVTSALPARGDQDRGLVIVHGRFDPDKFQAKAEQEAKDRPDAVKIHKIADGQGGKFLVYEINVSDQAPAVFVALPDKSTVLASPGKDYVVDAMKKAGGADKAELKNKEMQALLERMNDKQGVSLAMVGSALTEGLPQEVREVFDKVDVVGGGVTVDDGIKIEIAVSAKDAGDAKDIGDAIKADLKQAKLLLAALAFAESNDVDALLDAVNSVKVSVKDKTVLLKGAVSADVIEGALKKDK
jgi:hypothetical protein